MLSSLRLLYVQELEKNGFPNPEYRTENLKARLDNHEICELITIANVNRGDKGCITYNLVYSAAMFVAEALAYAYNLGSKDKYEDVALLLRSSIKQAFKESKPLPWPPSADNLEVKSSEELLPSDLVKFLNCVIDDPIDIDEHMRYSPKPVPHSLGTPDQFFNKTNKAAMLQYMMDDAPEEVIYPAESLYIQDGNALFRALKNLPPTFGEICLQVLDGG